MTMNRQPAQDDVDDVLATLTQLRPTNLDGWTAADREKALAHALNSDKPTQAVAGPHQRRRWFAAGAGIAAVAAAVTLIEVLPNHSPGLKSHSVPGGSSTSPQSSSATSTSPFPTPIPAPNSPVERLARAALHTTLPQPGNGQYWYHVTTGLNRHGKIVETNFNWVMRNGNDWDATKTPGQAWSCAYYPFLGTPNPNHVDRNYLDGLPTNPTKLYAYLRAHVSGGNSKADAVFQSVRDVFINYEGLVPPTLRAAYIRMLNIVPGVTVRADVTYAPGKQATVFTFGRAGDDANQLWFDQTTAQLVADGGAPVYQVVDHLPSRVANRRSCPNGGQ